MNAGAVAEKPPHGWHLVSFKDGSAHFRLTNWANFSAFLDEEIFIRESAEEYDYIWRGQRKASWPVVTTLDRIYERTGLLSLSIRDIESRTAEHLEAFKYAARGRRGLHPVRLERDNEWWALGQHFGLATPLLDWTRSPFAAAYFAFEGLESEPETHRAIYALDRVAVERWADAINNGPSFESGRPPVIEFVDPLSDENPRLVSQGGLFTRSPIGSTLESLIAVAFVGSQDRVLTKIEVPDDDRSMCLRALDRMNINHTSLFPDLIGASRATNLKLELSSMYGGL